MKIKPSNDPGQQAPRITTFWKVWAAILLFFFLPSHFSFLVKDGKAVCAQQAQPAPGKVAKPKISFTGGPGDTPKTAIIISGAPNSRVGIDAEYYLLERIFGRPNVDWKLERQSVLHQKNKIYDKMELELKNGKKMTIFFDITEFYGKL